MSKLTIVTGDTHKLVEKYIDDNNLQPHWDFPERTLSNPELVNFIVNDLIFFMGKAKHEVITTMSLFVFRELDILLSDYKFGFEVEWVNVTEEKTFISDSPDGIGALVMLDTELEQSDRYINKENKLQ